MSEDAAGDREDHGGRRRPGGADPPSGGGAEAVEPGGEIAVVGGEDIGALVGAILDEDPADSRRRAGLLRRLAAELAARARSARSTGAARGRWLADVFANEIAPRIPVRDRATLLAHYRGLEGEELADALVRSATRATTAVGAAGGALAAVQFTAPPLLLTAPAQLVAETVVVASVEVKLIAELHEVYGAPVSGSTLQRTTGYLGAWARKRGIDPVNAPEALPATLGAAARTALQRRLMRLLGRHMTTLGPYLTGAVAGGTLNRAATRGLAASVRADLRARGLSAPTDAGLGGRAAAGELPDGGR
ncbi:hypothetical protein [Streptomonospora salina]|uniref:EcsC family protein n=1 Tax=Streptomonospora salina TaxID=104205 RepID=A0A841EIQ9_9ACTN|nr:hypothetical protein [Streptomonospora salina]